MIQTIFTLSSHFFFIFISFQLFYKVVDWNRFFKVTGENERAIRLLMVFFSIALGYLVSSFFLTIWEASRSFFQGNF
ncbi:DUF1146 family protein [Streptococcus massiliensis]|nr:DUF1146 family protein [Streptococcus massiliensis]